MSATTFRTNGVHVVLVETIGGVAHPKRIATAISQEYAAGIVAALNAQQPPQGEAA